MWEQVWEQDRGHSFLHSKINGVHVVGGGAEGIRTLETVPRLLT